MAGVDVQGERTVFTKDQYRLVHTRWAYDGANRELYPVESLFLAESPTARLVARMRATATEPLRGELPAPLPVPLVYEQPADFEGFFQQRDPGGAWRPALRFQGGGFKEYTGSTRQRRN